MQQGLTKAPRQPTT